MPISTEPLPPNDVDTMDDLYLLRYIMSYTTAEAAAPIVLKAIQHRADNRADVIISRKGGVIDIVEENRDALGSLQVLDVPHVYGGPVALVRTASANPTVVMDRMGHDGFIRVAMALREQLHYRCDCESRRTGTLVKAMVVQDFAGTSILQHDRRFMGTMAAVSRLSEVVFPQLLERAALLNCPTWARLIYRAVRPLLSARLVRKIGICPGTATAAAPPGDIKRCPFASGYFPPGGSVLPRSLGGEGPEPHLFGGGEGPAAAVVAAAAESRGAEEPTAEEVAEVERIAREMAADAAAKGEVDE